MTRIAIEPYAMSLERQSIPEQLLQRLPKRDRNEDRLETTTFGGEPKEADALVALVLDGKKTATCWAARFGQLSYVGKRVALCDSTGKVRAILETTSLERRRFCDIDEAWAQSEGEGDGTLEHWRTVHEAFFRREGYFLENMDLWCERFQIVEHPPSGG